MNMNKTYFFQIFLVYSVFLVFSCGNVKAQGAITPFITYEAETATLDAGASLLSMSSLPSAPTVELESSGRKCVKLDNTGEALSWITTKEANAIVLRASIPDATAGGGIEATLNLYVDGIFRQAFTLSSKYTWVYGVTNFKDNNPSTGTPKKFYDSYKALISGAPIPEGSTVTIKKAAENTAPYYIVDFIQLENVGPALSQPENTLSVLAYGAIANDGLNDANAFKLCITDCKAQGKGMWIPEGVFHTSGIISANGISIYGAGMWYTTNARIIGDRHKWDLTNCTIQDLYIENHEVGRELLNGHDYGMTVQGAGGWTVQRVWVHRAGASFWCSGTDGTIKDCRSTESWADGINLNNGPSPTVDKRGFRLTCDNNFIIGSTDDGIAVNAQNGGGTEWNIVDLVITNNTSLGTIWANGMRVAGGRNTLVKNNLITDISDGSGIRIGKFGTNGNPCESVLVTENLILRACGIRPTYGHAGITIADQANATVTLNTINDSPGRGIEIQSCTLTLTSNMVNNSTDEGVLIMPSASGSAILTTNTVKNTNGKAQFRNDSPSTFTYTSSNNSWDGVLSIFDLGPYNNDRDSKMFSLYPNPLSQQTLKIDLIGFPEEKEVNIKVLNILGKIIYEKLEAYSKNIELENALFQSKGTYMIIINSGKYFSSEKLIVQ